MRDAAILVAVAIALARASGLAWPFAADFHAYWVADLNSLYTGAFSSGSDAFLYSPLFAQVTEPLRWLPYDFALGLWTLAELLSLVYLAGPWAIPLMLPLAPEWLNGNVHLIMAAAVVIGLRRHPAGWVVPTFTKLSPAIGLGWFALRGEWRTFAQALAIVGALAAVSFALAPGLWFDWMRLLVDNIGVGSAPPHLGGHSRVPILVRLPVALALLAWGARTGRSWTVPLACGIAMPVLWISAAIAFALAAWKIRLATHEPSR